MENLCDGFNLTINNKRINNKQGENLAEISSQDSEIFCFKDIGRSRNADKMLIYFRSGQAKFLSPGERGKISSAHFDNEPLQCMEKQCLPILKLNKFLLIFGTYCVLILQFQHHIL